MVYSFTMYTYIHYVGCYVVYGGQLSCAYSRYSGGINKLLLLCHMTINQSLSTPKKINHVHTSNNGTISKVTPKRLSFSTRTQKSTDMSIRGDEANKYCMSCINAL